MNIWNPVPMAVPASTTITTYFTFSPRYELKCQPSEFDSLIVWVKENCKGGWMIQRQYLGNSTILIDSDDDYAWYLLKWCRWGSHD